MALEYVHEDARQLIAPVAFGGDGLIWATWLYHAEGRTQSEVAEALGVSRASVANYLAEARRRGLVRITLEPTLLQRVAASKALTERFGLNGAHVAPALEPSDDGAATALRQRVGAAAAHVLTPLLTPQTTMGVAWGRTMLELARALPDRSLPGLRVIQVSGSSLGDAESSPEACTALIAGRLGARCQNFHAPAVVTSRSLRDALLAEPTLLRHRGRLKACDLVVFGVGELKPGLVWSDTDFLPDSVAHEYLALGAVAVLIGRFVNAAGTEVDGPLGGRQIGMELTELKRVPLRLCVAAGPEKVEAIRATLAGGFATHLVTDEATGRHLLENAP